jgi:hypothetical protein
MYIFRSILIRSLLSVLGVLLLLHFNNINAKGGYYGYHGQMSPFLSLSDTYGPYKAKIERLKFIRRQMKALPELKKRLIELTRFLEKDPKNEEHKCEKRIVEKEISFIESVLEQPWGDIMLRAFAGKNWRMVEDISVGGDIAKGFLMGAALRGTSSIEKAVGYTIDNYVNSLFAIGLDKIEKVISSIYRFFFHGSCKPFDIMELDSWNKLVGSDFREIEEMIKKAEKYDSRGRAEILREYKTQDIDEGSVLSVNLWNDFVEDVANTYEDLAEEINLRKGYYNDKENGFGVVQCAERLKNKLLKAKSWLLRVESLKDFVNTPEVKSIIPSMRKSFDIYFKNLSAQIKLPIEKTGILKTSGGYTSSDRWGNGFDDTEGDFPARYE